MQIFFIFCLVLVLVMGAGWINHIMYCFENSEWVLLLVGAIAAPLGALHGIYLWF